jgi:Ca2+-binding EF-hand superfamily protein
MIDLGYNLSNREATEIVNHFDKSGRGCLGINDFVGAMF